MANTLAEITDIKYLRNIVIPFLKEHSNKRISSSLINYYQDYTLHKPEGDDIVICEVKEEDSIVAISLATIKKNSNTVYSTTVTAKPFRKKGYGLQALRSKLEYLKSKGRGIKSIIAEDNIPALALCNKAGLKQVDIIDKLRKTGPYKAIIWTDPPKIQ